MIEESKVEVAPDELDPKGILLKDIKSRGAEVLEFHSDAAYLIIFSRGSIRNEEAAQVAKVLNERGIITDVVIVDGKPQDVINAYRYDLPGNEKTGL